MVEAFVVWIKIGIGVEGHGEFVIVLCNLVVCRREEAQTHVLQRSGNEAQTRNDSGVNSPQHHDLSRAASQGALESAGAILKAIERGKSTEIQYQSEHADASVMLVTDISPI